MILPPVFLCVDIVTLLGVLIPPPHKCRGSSVRVSVHLKPRSQTSARPAGRDVGAPSGITYKHAYYKTAYARRCAQKRQSGTFAPCGKRNYHSGEGNETEITSECSTLDSAFGTSRPHNNRARGVTLFWNCRPSRPRRGCSACEAVRVRGQKQAAATLSARSSPLSRAELYHKIRS